MKQFIKEREERIKMDEESNYPFTQGGNRNSMGNQGQIQKGSHTGNKSVKFSIGFHKDPMSQSQFIGSGSRNM